MKTILFHVNTLLAGGIEKVMIELLQALDPKQYNIKLSIGHNLGANETLKPQIPSYVTIEYILTSPILTYAVRKKHTANITGIEKLLSEIFLPGPKRIAYNKRLKEILADVDVIIDFDMTLSSYHKAMGSRKKIAYCHFSLAHYYDGNKRKLNKLANRLHQYDKVIMLCDEMKQDADKLYPMLKEKTVRLYNALNIERIKQLADEPFTGEQKLLDTGYFVSVGRLQESQKDFTSLIRAYAQCIKQCGIKQYLVIVGDGGYRQQLEELAKTEDVAERVVFAGFDKNPYKWVRHAEAFIFSSKYEGLPTVLIEALALECPLVATECPTGVREILMNGEAGILTPVGDIAALKDGMHKILDKDLQAKYISNSKKLIHEFDMKFMLKEFERIVLS